MTQDFADFKAPGNKPILNSIFDASDNFLGELRLWLEQNPPAVPVTSVLGFSQFTVQPAPVVATARATSSATYTDLSGPTLSGLSDGKYAIFFGCYIFTAGGGASGWASIQVNSTAATDADSAQSAATVEQSVMRLVTKSLSNSGNNTVTMKYRSNGTATFGNRWLIALRYSNL